MKHIKLFESFHSDKILDKISKHGIDSLTDLEKTYLDLYSKDNPEYKSIEKEFDKESKFIDGALEYDPRDDNEFHKDNEMDFSEWSDEDIESGKFEIIWDGLSEKSVENFIKTYKIDINKVSDNGNYLAWDNLPIEVKGMFIDFIKTHN